MKILCVYPALLSGWASYVPHGSNESSYMNHGFAMLSAVLKRAGHEPFLVDLRSLQNWEDFERILREMPHDFSMVSFLSCDEAFAREATSRMKKVEPNKLIIAGGIHLSVTQSREYSNVDIVVLGEGEEHILEIAGEIQAGRKPKPVYDVKPVTNLDNLPFVDRSFFNSEMEETSPLLPLLPEPFVTIVAGRGCPGKCTFCAPSRERISGKKCRIRTVGHFLEEVCLLNSRPGGIGSLMIHDDLWGSKTWMSEFIEEWQRRLPRIPIWCQLRADTIIRMHEFIPDLARIGLTWVSLGLESGSQRMLDFLQKGTTVEQNIEASGLLHENHVNIFGNYIMGLPTETKEDVDATEKMLAEIRPEWHSQSVYTSYPGSYLYEWIRENDYWVTGDSHYRRIRYPYERMIKGIDYPELFRKGARWSTEYKSSLKEYPVEVTLPLQTALPFTNQISEPVFPRISIITLSYCRPAYLREAIQSMFDQTMHEWELIILDNTPADDTVAQGVKEVCEEAAQDPRVWVFYRGRNNDNLAHDWNEGLDLIRGEYWALLDDDDRKHPTFCEKMVRYLDEHAEKQAAVCGVQYIGRPGQRMAKPDDVGTLRISNKIGSGEVVYRRSVIERIGYFDERMISQEDWDYILRFFDILGLDAAVFMGEILADYRWHSGKRMERSHELKMLECAKVIQTKYQPAIMKVAFGAPRGVTQSQMQVSGGIRESLQSSPFIDLVEDKPEVVLVAGPLWHFSKAEIAGFKQSHQVPMLALLTEDPQGITGNLPFVNEFDWLVTNDIHAFDFYRSMFHIPEQVYHWNCLSISDRVMELCNQNLTPEKTYDLCFIGYPYPSRIDFVRRLRELLPEVNMILVGDTWDQKGINGVMTFPTLDDYKTASIGLASRIILCKHRTEADIGGFPVILPGSVNRGYIECAYHALVMIDSDRHFHPFTDEVEWYGSVEDAAEKIKHYLATPDALNEKAEKAFSIAGKFTYRERVGKILSGFRSPRYGMRVD